ncbi:MAG TPA: hypothetical protein VJ179_04100 [Patescibacteria group bacterium]|nr:hypothetical protein [Patescibacteria group bacterium]
MWVILGILLVISFFLAYRSLREFTASPVSQSGERKVVLEVTDRQVIGREFFDNLHQLMTITSPNQNMSFEVLVRSGEPRFFLSLPESLMPYLTQEKWVRRLGTHEDYAYYLDPKEEQYAACELTLAEENIYPLSLETDMSKLIDEFTPNDALWFQAVGFVVDSSWKQIVKRERYVISQQVTTPSQHAGAIAQDVIKQLFAVFTGRPLPEPTKVAPKTAEIVGKSAEEQAAVDKKMSYDAFLTKLRLVVVSSDRLQAREKLSRVVQRLSEMSTKSGYNRLQLGSDMVSSAGVVYSYRKRSFLKEVENACVLTTQELSELANWHVYEAKGGEKKLEEEVARTKEALDVKPSELTVPAKEVPVMPPVQTKVEIEEKPAIVLPKIPQESSEPFLVEEEEAIKKAIVTHPPTFEPAKEVEKEPSHQVFQKGKISGEVILSPKKKTHSS